MTDTHWQLENGAAACGAPAPFFYAHDRDLSAVNCDGCQEWIIGQVAGWMRDLEASGGNAEGVECPQCGGPLDGPEHPVENAYHCERCGRSFTESEL